ncbi:MAG: YitT family protein [Acholeplasmataceae bacterium]|nr:YitT family protein [Acholeplasmataceae bacterium]
MNSKLNHSKKQNLKVVSGMIAGTIIYSMGVVWLLDLAQFYAGGVTGFSQLLSNFLGQIGIPISKSIFIAILNIPLFIIGWRGVSFRFALLSLFSVVIQVITVAVLEMLLKYGVNPFQKALTPSGGMDHGAYLTIAVLGGLVCGVGSGISLRSGASTGGMDIISQYLSFKKRIPFAYISLSADLVIIILSAFVGTLETAIYTIIRLIITILVLDRIHTIYKYMKLEIITTECEAMRQAMITNFNHGVTIYKAIGGYSGQDKWVLESVVSSYEAEEYKNLAMKIDPKSFIIFTAVKHIQGLFNHNVIA